MTMVENSPAETGQAVLERIRDLAPLIRQHAADGERARRVPEEVITALKQAGAFGIAVPHRYGGTETDLRTMLDVSAAVAEADGGAAWVVALSNINAWVAAQTGGRLVDDFYGTGPDTVIAGVLAPSGQARRVPGGYRVSGKWAYSSASLHADWAYGGVSVLGDDETVIDQAMVAIPRGEFHVEDTWYVAGMRASGSNTIVAEDVFVPEHRLIPVAPAMDGANIGQHPDSALYRSAMGPMLVMVLVGPQLGLGRAALDIAIKGAGKSQAYTIFDRRGDSVAFQLLIAEAAVKVDTAHLHAYRACADVQRYAERGEFPDLVARARIRSDAGVALRSINQALNLLLDANGSGSFAEVNALQRIWRDSNIAARHGVMLPHISMETYGKALVGGQDQITHII
ncbi:acyl-CoA dehydrogenase family protein [Mycobacterium sp. 21AC1]|uniref:acyl-CoA dehydrogenase family protein n=1 Tax=[Mycobacterium] appelbergii TaxID=2939269 RepID=UPI002938F200|nr:acyl-CoA dehydrogenase family protein [Mycobacterium sp. 21AC1]MDV3128820.1 acyl-CoA dehydrogenase family protein [Mycobacterium sp. 21AC1]